MNNTKFIDTWETVVISKEAIVRRFKSERSGKELCEIVLPEQLPEGAPDCSGWHFYMPGTCVKETENSASLKIPPSWGALRFLSPYVKGTKPKITEYPIEEALELLRATFAQH